MTDDPIPEHILKIARSITADLPRTVTQRHVPFIENVIARAIRDEARAIFRAATSSFDETAMSPITEAQAIRWMRERNQK